MRRTTKLIALAVVLMLGALSWLIVSILQSVPVDSLFADPDGKGIEIRIIENSQTVGSLRVNKDSDLLTEVKRMIEHANPTWRWQGYRPDVSKDSFRIDIMTSVCTTHIDSSGMMQVQDLEGRDRRAHTPRSHRLYDRIADVVRIANRLPSPAGGPAQP